MLEVKKTFKIRKDNLYILVDYYRLTNLVLDLWGNTIFIEVEFFRDDKFLFRQRFETPDKQGDIDVDKQIEYIHKLLNEY
jgi:hypothetical protein